MRKNRLLTAFSFLVFMFMFIPLAIIIVTSFGEGSTIEFPIKGFTLKWYGNIFASRTFVSGFTLSLQIGLAATILALIIGIPAAYALSRSEVPRKKQDQELLPVSDDSSRSRCWLLALSVHSRITWNRGLFRASAWTLPHIRPLCHKGRGVKP